MTAAESQVDQIARLVIRPGAIVTEGTDTCVDQRRIVLANRVVANASSIQVIAGTGIDDDVGRLGQSHELTCALVGIKIDDNTALAEVIMPEMQAAVGMGLVVVKWAVTPRSFATERFDLDNVRTQTGKNFPAIFAKFVRQLDHPDPHQGNFPFREHYPRPRCDSLLPIRALVF